MHGVATIGTAPEIELLTEDELADASRAGSPGSALAETARYVLTTSGKQLRPRLVFLAAGCGSHPHDPRVREAAKAVELVHLSTLLHDDVIDDSDLRRGKPTVGARYGAFAATTAGGLLFASAIGSAVRCGAESARILTETVCALCDGQMLETQDLYDVDRSVRRYERAIAGKTASLFACAARLGAIAGGASPAVVRTLDEFGHRLGMAYQIADDVLDLVGKVPGKRPGDDLRHGTYTLPVILALERDRRLRERLASGHAEADMATLIDAMERAGGVRDAIAACRQHAAAARSRAREVPRGAPLVAYVDSALGRCLEEVADDRRPTDR